MSRKKSEDSINRYKNEVYLLAFLTTGDRNPAKRLVEETIIKTKNSLYSIKTEERLIKIFINQYKNYLKKNEPKSLSNFIKTDNLVKNLANLDGMQRIIIILRYYKNYEITKIARLMGVSVPKVRTYLIQGIPIWANTSKNGSINLLYEAFQQEISEVKLKISQDKYTYDDNHSAVNKSIQVKGKLALQSAFLAIILIIGGTINEGTIDKTRASQGPDLIRIYNEGTLNTVIDQEFAKAGFQDVYAYPDYIGKFINVSTGNAEAFLKREEIINMVEAILKNRGIDFQIYFDYYGPVEEENTELVVEENLTKDDLIYKEIYGKIAFSDYQNYIWIEYSDESWHLNLPDVITKEEEAEILQKASEILDDHKDKRKVYIFNYDYKEVDTERRWYALTEYMYEGLILGYPNLINEVYLDYLDNKMQINIKTAFFQTDVDATPTAREIKRSIRNFLQYEPVKKIIKEDEYIINVNAINQQVIETE